MGGGGGVGDERRLREECGEHGGARRVVRGTPGDGPTFGVVTLADLSTVLQGGRLDENVNRVQLRQLGPTDAVCRHVNRRPVPERGRPEVEHEH